MLYALPCAALAAAWALAACWRCRALRRALTRERVAARLDQDAWARDVAALERAAHEETAQAAREAHVLAQACAVVDQALAAAGRNRDTPKEEDTDG
ncbi:hypothetical protein [Streptomyces sp.]|uniref:hypothetical protein n=1 Tax=Streptomyces sp. TaxID=1931 RepID=UPI002F420C2E